MKISEIAFSAGKSRTAPTLILKPTNVTIIVGPNNSGKSLSLREIETYFKTQSPPFGPGAQGFNFKVIKSITVNFPRTMEETMKDLEVLKIDVPKENGQSMGEPVGVNDFWVKSHSFDRNTGSGPTLIREADLIRAIANPDVMRGILGRLYTIRLDGLTRFNLVEPISAGDLSTVPMNHLWALFKDEQKSQEVSELTYEAFGLYFLIDPTNLGQFRIRMSEKLPAPDEVGVRDKAVKFYNSIPLISELGDGVKAFVGLLAAIHSLPHKIILIDEPEAFLHPPLARRLGYNLAKISEKRDASLIVATHSSQFLMGCLDSGVDVSIVRLTYERPFATARSLEAKEVKAIMNDAIMRSSDVLQALFARAAIVTEGDSDRVFYEEINRRLQLEGRGINDALFLNAQNVHTLYKIVGPLRKIGIAAVAIADIDFIFETEKAWMNLLEACEVPESNRAKLITDIKSFAVKGDNLKELGVASLDVERRTKGFSVLAELQNYGLFLVPVGELECWLKEVRADRQKSIWLSDLFTKIGNSEEDSNYLKPSNHDIWAFIDTIAEWTEKRNKATKESAEEKVISGSFPKKS